MNVLGYIAHNGVSAVFNTEFQDAVDHHAEILRLIDDHMVGFADNLGFFYTFIKVSEGSQIVNVESCRWDIRFMAFGNLFQQELLIQIKNGAFPGTPTVPAVV